MTALRYVSLFWHIRSTSTNAHRERNPPTTSKFQPIVIRDSNSDCQIDADPDVCRISKMFWMHYLVGVSHHQLWYKSAVDCMRNANKCPKIPYSAMVKKLKNWSGITHGSGSPPKVNQEGRRGSPLAHVPSLVDIRFHVRQSCLQNDGMTDRTIT